MVQSNARIVDSVNERAELRTRHAAELRRVRDALAYTLNFLRKKPVLTQLEQDEAGRERATQRAAALWSF